ncbi:citrulline utilization hydrolase CtlX [Sphingobacterium gobiense]|uniref:Amidinotransferase n=1 Tax=Sphingobacterium gobiense TaxID=1382456 RepID=A0A2S9JL33_9SPHI|nr:arginine deiminase-related protein [Sphingobacterium gobiense]PRD53831.1 amidinotransferase [Sphingobacterium gobiense]
MKQTTDTLLLVRPYQFRKNEETAVNNYFQEDLLLPLPAQQAQEEFDNFVNALNAHKINTFVIQDEGDYDTPDSIFPNNCISFHKRTAVLYPMFAENRRRERKLDYLNALQRWGLTFDDIIDYTSFEKENRFLEGTGSLILDRINRIAYCSLSPRADAGVAHQFCLDLGYELFIFEANQTVGGLRKPIYHTNVMMSLGTQFAVVCTDSIDNRHEKMNLIKRLNETGKKIVDISEDQVNSFAGNILEVQSITGDPFIVMSSQAYQSFTAEQLGLLYSWGQIIHNPLDTIERGGGGSARCMVAEVFY